jgi:hypothetical protein
MVRVGQFSVILKSASTHAPLVEHQSGPVTYVEAIAGEEYFVRIVSHEPNTLSIANITVDGAHIGFHFQQGPDMNMDASLGMMSDSSRVYAAGVPAPSKAFRFARMRSGQSLSAAAGKVTVTWHQGIDSGMAVYGSAYGQWAANQNATAPDSEKAGVGALQSEPGAAASTNATALTAWGMGALLQTTMIHYREPAGLAAAGIIRNGGAGSAGAGAGGAGSGGGGSPGGPTQEDDDIAAAIAASLQPQKLQPQKASGGKLPPRAGPAAVVELLDESDDEGGGGPAGSPAPARSPPPPSKRLKAKHEPAGSAQMVDLSGQEQEQEDEGTSLEA